MRGEGEPGNEAIVCVDNCFIDGDNSFNESFLSSAPMLQVLLQNKVEHNILQTLLL